MSDSKISTNSIVIERTFDAPIDLIWQLWTEAEHFKSWYGPKGMTVPVAKIDARVGGKRLVCMESADGNMKMWLAGEHTEVTPNTRLVYTESISDENGNVATTPSDDDHPGITHVIVQLEDLGERTKMIMTHEGVPADSPGASGWEQAITKMSDYIKSTINEKS